MKFFSKEQLAKIKHSSILILIGFAIGALLVGGITLAISKKHQKEKASEIPPKEVLVVEDKSADEWELTVEYVEKKLENLSELSTAQMIYSGICTVESGKIPIINKKGFSMVYQGEVKAGIDISKLKTEISEDKVVVMIPSAEILVSHVLPETVKFFDERHSIFNPDKKTDVTEALTLAESDMQENAATDGLLTRAEEQAEIIVQGLLQDVVGDRQIKVMHSS